MIETKDKLLQIRIKKSQYRCFKEKAAKLNKSVSDYVITLIEEDCKK